MKKIFLLCVIALTVMACPSNDDVEPTTENSIVGTWKFLESFENNIQEDIEPCDTEETFVFSENGDFYAESYTDENQDGICDLDEEDSQTGTWSNLGNLYTITIGGEAETDEITFDGNTFSVEETDTEDGVTYTYKYVYVRQ